MKKGLKDNNQKNLSKSLRKKLQTSKGRIIFALSTVMLIVVLNMIISKTTGFNAIERSYNYIAKAVNGEKDIKKEYTEEIKSVSFQSKDYGEPGSWKIDKSAEWTGLGKAKVTFNVDTIEKIEDINKDVILVIDVSGSMRGDKLNKAKEDAIALVEVLLSNKNNKVALITFDTTSKVVSEFTSNRQDMISAIESLMDKETTNYNQALKNVDKVMNNYTRDPNRDVVTLFLTDGYPNEETPNQVATYKILKDKYPYMTINGIQYEMGKDIIKQIIEISDNQWVASQDTLDNVLFEASISPIIYEKYEVIDYINNEHFKVVSKDDITVSIGTVELLEENGQQKVVWTLDPFMTGRKATMDINLVLKEEYKKVGGYYPTNKKEEVNYNLPSEEEQQVKSDLTPVLKNQYEVIYDTNAPKDCELQKIPNDSHFVYDNVVINRDKLTCDGYTFRGWEIIEVVQKVNDDVFIMPAHNVTIRATWSKSSIDKSMEGTVWEDKTLYKVVADEAKKPGGRAKEYTDTVEDTFEKDANEKVYYYTGTVTKNNVIFAKHCWKIVRTTTTGGVKLLYNGTPSYGKCTATGAAATIGDSVFNTEYTSPAYVGYMYNKVYTIDYTLSPKGPYGADVEYKNGVYTLKQTSETLDDEHHYSCNDGTDKCTTVRYYYSKLVLSNTYYYYIELNEAENIEEAINEMLYDKDVNQKDSTIKEVIDGWYKENILDTDYEEKLEDTIFCNDRSMSNKDANGWNPKGGSLSTYMYFKTDLTCENETDKFSMNNYKAHLEYPIGLLSEPEANLMGDSARNIEKFYWLGSPRLFSNVANVRYVMSYMSDSLGSGGVNASFGVRPAVSLVPGTVYSGGDGTTTSPFVID